MLALLAPTQAERSAPQRYGYLLKSLIRRLLAGVDIILGGLLEAKTRTMHRMAAES